MNGGMSTEDSSSFRMAAALCTFVLGLSPGALPVQGPSVPLVRRLDNREAWGIREAFLGWPEALAGISD